MKRIVPGSASIRLLIAGGVPHPDPRGSHSTLMHTMHPVRLKPAATALLVMFQFTALCSAIAQSTRAPMTIDVIKQMVRMHTSVEKQISFVHSHCRPFEIDDAMRTRLDDIGVAKGVQDAIGGINACAATAPSTQSPTMALPAVLQTIIDDTDAPRRWMLNDHKWNSDRCELNHDDAGYEIVSKEKAVFCSTTYPTGVPARARYELTINHSETPKGGLSAGLILGVTSGPPAASYKVYFWVGNVSNQVSVVRVVNYQAPQEILKWTKTTNLHGPTVDNKIVLDVVDRQMSIYINGQLDQRITLPSNVVGTVGYYVDGVKEGQDDAKVKFMRFKVSAIP